jgi:hypothetical protein
MFFYADLWENRYPNEIEIYDTPEEIMAIQLSEKVAQSPMDEW